MRESALAAIAALFALCTLSSFSSNAVFIFGISIAIIIVGILVRKAVIGIMGIFVLGVLSPFAMGYGHVVEGFTLISVTALVTISVAVLTHLAATSDEKRRFNWRVERRSLAVTVIVTLLVVHSIVIMAAIGVMGTFLGDVETTGARVIILAFAASLAGALILVPPADEPESA